MRDLPSGVSSRAAGGREGAAGPGDVAPARVGQAGGSGVWASFWARLRAAAALRASVALRAFSAELAAFFGLVMLPRLTALGFFIIALGYHEIDVDNLAIGS